MNVVTQIALLLDSLILLAVAPLELFFYGSPRARKFLHVDTKNLDDVRMWAFVIGFRNALAGIGGLVGLVILHTGDPAVAHGIILTVLWYMLLSGLAMGVADLLGYWHPHGGSVMGTISSSVLPLVGLVAAAVVPATGS